MSVEKHPSQLAASHEMTPTYTMLHHGSTRPDEINAQPLGFPAPISWSSALWYSSARRRWAFYLQYKAVGCRPSPSLRGTMWCRIRMPCNNGSLITAAVLLCALLLGQAAHERTSGLGTGSVSAGNVIPDGPYTSSNPVHASSSSDATWRLLLPDLEAPPDPPSYGGGGIPTGPPSYFEYRPPSQPPGPGPTPSPSPTPSPPSCQAGQSAGGGQVRAPPVTHSCQLHLSSAPVYGSQPAVGGSLACVALLVNPEEGNAEANVKPVAVSLGANLLSQYQRGAFTVSGDVDIVNTRAARQPLRSLVPPPTYAPPTYAPPTYAPPYAPGASSAEDWGISFQGAPHVLLSDSSLAGVPLSTTNPLIHFDACSAVTFRNMTIDGPLPPTPAAAGDQQSSATAAAAYYGAVLTTGVQYAAIVETRCTGVSATTWACFMLQLEYSTSGLASVSIADSSFTHNEVQAPPADDKSFATSLRLDTGMSQCAKGQTFGAVLVTAAESPQRSSCMFVDVSSAYFSNNQGGRGGGLAVVIPQGAVSLAVANSTLANNTVTLGGGGLYTCVESGNIESVSLVGSDFSHNDASTGGGAVYMKSQAGNVGSILVGQSTTMAFNKADKGGALYLHTADGDISPGLFISGASNISFNQAREGDGGAVLVDSSSGASNVSAVHVTGNCSFTGNVAAAAGGALCVNSKWLDTLTIRGSHFVSNEATSNGKDGGAVCADTSVNRTVFENSSCVGNSVAGGGSGGCLYLKNAAFLEVANGSIFQGNLALDGLGGAVSIESGAVKVHIRPETSALDNAAMSGGFMSVGGMDNKLEVHVLGSLFRSNSAVSSDGSGGDGGALYIKADNAQELLLQDSNFTANSANSTGGAVSLREGATAKNISIRHCVMSDNVAGSNGGAFAISSDGGIQLVVINANSTFLGNTAGGKGSGGALYIKANDNIRGVAIMGNSQFLSNIASGAGGNGGAVYLWSEQGNVTGVTISSGAVFANNTADRHGGGLYVAVKQELEVDQVAYVDLVIANGTKFVNNNARYGKGGAIYALSGNLSPRKLSVLQYVPLCGHLSLHGSCSFESNTATAGGAIYLDGFFNVTASTANCSGNTATRGDGGCLALNRLPPSLHLQGLEMRGNSAPRGSGGAVAVTTNPKDFTTDISDSDTCFSCLLFLDGQVAASSLFVTNTSFTGNLANLDGGAVYILFHEQCCNTDKSYVDLAVTHSTFTKNSAVGAGGAITYQQSVTNDGARLKFTAAVEESTLLGNAAGNATRSFQNSASQGGAVFVYNKLPSAAGRDLSSQCWLSIRNSNFTQNGCVGGHGGAVMLAACMAEVSGSVFVQNSATLSGGAVAALHDGRSQGIILGLPASQRAAPSHDNQGYASPPISGTRRSLAGRQHRWLCASPALGEKHKLAAGCQQGSVRPPNAPRPAIIIADDHAPPLHRRLISTEAADELSAAIGGVTVSRCRDVQRHWYTWLRNCTFSANSANLEFGGAVYLDAQQRGQAVVTGCRFKGNTADREHGGGAFLAADGECAAAIITTDDDNATSTASSGGSGATTFTDNTALRGSAGGVYVLVGEGAYGFLRADFTGNKALSGGAIVTDVQASAQLNVSGCNATGGNSASIAGGAVYLAARCGAEVALTSNVITNNSAGASGGAVFMQQYSGTEAGLGGRCRDGSTLSWTGGVSAGNTAVGDGGSLYVAPGTAALVSGVSFRGDQSLSGAGGSVAAHNCSLLMVTNSSINGCSALTSGGGLYEFGCSHVLLDRVNVTDCSAGISGAGLYLGSPQQVPALLTANLSYSDAGAGKVIMSGIVAARNKAGTAGPTSAAANVSSIIAALEVTVVRPRGGGIYVDGAVAAVVSLSDLSEGNSAQLGSSLGSTQQCDQQAAGPGSSADAGTAADDFEGDPTDVFGQWASVWSKLAAAEQRRCWGLVLVDSLLPPLNIVTDNTSMEADANNVKLWMRDRTATALYASCSSPEVQAHVQSTVSNASAATAATAQSMRDAIITGLDSLLDQQQQGSRQPLLAGSAGPASRARYQQLQAALANCTAATGPPAGRQPYSVGLPPACMRLVNGSGYIRDENGSLTLRAGSEFSATVQLLDAFGQAVTTDMSNVSISMELLPKDPTGQTPSPGLKADGGRPWRNSSLANLDPGPIVGRSLRQLVANGSAEWLEVVPRGWPGEYSLVFRAAVTGAASAAEVYEVAALEVPVSLQHCVPGDQLQLDTAEKRNAPSWTACATCRAGTYNLWTDERPPLLFPEYNASDYLHKMKGTAHKLTDDGGIATCVPCPDDAVCPGGAVIVPKLGFWHSAPNSTAMHACPNPPACGGSGKTETWDSQSDGARLGSEQFSFLPDNARSVLLGRCQQDWYSGQQLANGTAGATARSACLLWGLPPDDNSSYMQLQCAEGYTGNMCAACVPGYYINSDFDCKQCPEMRSTLVLGLLAFAGNIVLVLSTMYTHFKDSYAEHTRKEGGGSQGQTSGGKDQGQTSEDDEKLGSGEVMAAVVTHCQYFIIITRLNINYPNSVMKSQAFLNSVTGAENYVAYSPSCLLPGEGSGGQARIQLLSGLITPCVVAACSLLLIMLRRRLFRTKAQSDLPATSQKTAAARSSADSCLRQEAAAGQDNGHPTANSKSLESRFSTLPSPKTPSPMKPSPTKLVLVDEEIASATVVVTPEAVEQGTAGGGPPSAKPSAVDVQIPPGTPPDTPTARQPAASAASVRQPAVAWRVAASLWRRSVKLLEPHTEVLVYISNHLSPARELKVALMVAMFVLYPGLAQASLSVFACYRIDSGTGRFAAAQLADWRHGYWVRDMQQECYSGAHLRVYVPIGVIAVFVFCLLPPVASFWMLWRKRHRCSTALEDPHTQLVYGFFYSRYREDYYWWESMLRLEALALVAVEVFGRTLVVSHQALLLLAVFIIIGIINMSCQPMRCIQLTVMEFLSLSTLSLTITLGLYFVVDDPLLTTAGDTIGVLLLLVNMVFLLGALALALTGVWPTVWGWTSRAWPGVRDRLGPLMPGQCAACGRGTVCHGGSAAMPGAAETKGAQPGSV